MTMKTRRRHAIGPTAGIEHLRSALKAFPKMYGTAIMVLIQFVRRLGLAGSMPHRMQASYGTRIAIKLHKKCPEP
jgi:hypothetical protein